MNFVTELLKDEITELRKNGTATGELFSMSDTKFVAEKTTLVRRRVSSDADPARPAR